MKTFSVNKNSWHYKLNARMVKTNERLNRNDNAEKYVQSRDNLCSYWQMTLWSMFKVAVTAAFLIGLASLSMVVIYLMGYGMIYHTTSFLLGAGAVIGLAMLTVGAIALADWLDRRKKVKLDKILYEGETETSLAGAKYSSWKSGVCVPVEFKV